MDNIGSVADVIAWGDGVSLCQQRRACTAGGRGHMWIELRSSRLPAAGSRTARILRSWSYLAFEARHRAGEERTVVANAPAWAAPSREAERL